MTGAIVDIVRTSRFLWTALTEQRDGSEKMIDWRVQQDAPRRRDSSAKSILDEFGDVLAGLAASGLRSISCDAAAVLGISGDAVSIVAATDATPAGRIVRLPCLTGADPDSGEMIRQRVAGPPWPVAGWSDDAPGTVLAAPVVLGGKARTALVCLYSGDRMPGREDEDRLRDLAASVRALSERYRANTIIASVARQTPVSILVADARKDDLPMVYLNPAFTEVTGFPHEDYIGVDCRKLVPNPDTDPTGRKLVDTINARGSGRFLVRSRRFDGAEIWNLLTVFPVLGSDGKADFMVATHMDVTTEIGAQRDRDDERSRMIDALAVANDSFIFLDDEGKILMANERARDFLAATEEEMQPGRNLRDVFYRQYIKAGWAEHRAQTVADERVGQVFGGVKNIERETLDGRNILLNANPIPGGGAIIVGTDITEQKQTERRLAELVAAVDAANDAIAVADENECFVYVNEAHVQMYGYESADQMLGKSTMMLYGPAQQKFVREVVDRDLFGKGEWRGELSATRRDGKVFYHEVTFTKLEGQGYIRVARDVSERHRMVWERERLREQLFTAQRREAVGHLAAGVAHDFNNLISAVAGSAALMNGAIEPASPLRVHTARIEKAAQQASELVNRLLAVAAPSRKREQIDLREPLSQAAELLRSALSSQVALKVAMPDDAIMAEADPTEVSQVILNIGLNARDALERAPGTVTFTLSTVGGGEAAQRQGRILVGLVEPEVDYALLSVTDDGQGIQREQLDKIFRHYYSTKGEGGTGLGLAVVAGIVESAEGAIAVDTQPGRGTTLDVYWPLAGQRPAAEQAQDRALNADLTGETILVVDDEPAVAEHLAMMLEQAGAAVAVCTDARDALASISEDPAAWSLLVTDFDMPYINGLELARTCRELRADLPILMCTAHVRRLRERDPDNKIFTRMVLKPISSPELVAAAAAAISDRPETG